jgi:hypothetical protein
MRRPFSLRNRSIYFWLNVGFVVVIICLLLGAANQLWFVGLAVIWVGVGLFAALRNGRNSPPPPNLFDDDDRND